MQGWHKHASDLGEGFAGGAKMCLSFGGRFCRGWHKRASDLGEDFAWVAETCLRFGGRFCTVCINVPQFWGKVLHGVHKRLPVLGRVFTGLKR